MEQQELTSLKEHQQNLSRDNQILKRAVAIQHERNLEQEEKTREVQQLKHVISQYQEQVRTLEVVDFNFAKTIFHLVACIHSSCLLL